MRRTPPACLESSGEQVDTAAPLQARTRLDHKQEELEDKLEGQRLGSRHTQAEPEAAVPVAAARSAGTGDTTP